MAEARQKAVAGTLDELCHSVAADGGAALYLDDGEGALQRVASSGSGGVRSPRLLEQLRDDNNDQRSLVLTIPGTPAGVVVLTRKSGRNFTQQDRAVARLWVRRLAEGALAAGARLAPSVWARRIEAIQRIGARLNRLGAVQEVTATICRGTFEIFDNDEAHLLLADDQGYLQPIAHMTRDNGTPPALPYDGAIARHIDRALTASMPVLEKSVTDAGPDRAGPHSLLIVPLLHEGHVSGLLCLIAAGEGRFDDDHLRLLQILSDQAAVAIDNARLLSGRDDLVNELAGLLEISEAAGAASDERQLATQLATRMRRATSADAARVSRWEEGSTVLRLLGRDGGAGGEDIVELSESALRWSALRDGRPVLAQVDALDHGAEARRLRASGVRTLLLLPLTAGGRTIGLVELLVLQQPLNLNESQLHALEAMASLTATGLERVRLLEQLRSAADTDLVTGVHNHRYLQERLRQEVTRSARSHSELAVLMMDLDKFKQVNDRHGHAEGDGVLHNIGATIMAEVRANDIVARYGGDEFVVIMPDTSTEQAELVADRVVRAIRTHHHALSDGAQVTVGVSAGLAIYPTDGRTTAQLLGAADAAMYDIKRTTGRDIERAAGHPAIEAAAAN
ncbi:MAG: diguanylate cyclase [Candidatus Limnocylindrales bacterium]